jgi:hypothetical protein
MLNHKWRLHVFQSGFKTFFVIATDYASGLVEAFKIDTAGCWEHLGGHQPLNDVRLFYAVDSNNLSPEVRSSLRAYLTSPEFETRIDSTLKVCICAYVIEGHTCLVR